MERLPEEGGGAVMSVTPNTSPVIVSLTLGSMLIKSSAVIIPPAALHHETLVYTITIVG